MIESGKKVKLHYTLTVEGEVIDSSTGEETFEYTHGVGQIIPGLEKQLEGLEVGDERDIAIPPQDAYGFEDPEAFVEVQRTELPEGDVFPGMQFVVTREDGSRLPVTVVEMKENTVILNLNHPLAGKELHFKIEIVEIE